MSSRNFLTLVFLFSPVVVAYLFSASISYASYQKIAPGDTVTIGEFVFDDDFVATTTDCTVGITSPLNVEVVPSTTPMTANNDGWHYYNYTTASNAVSGVWPSIIICGSTQHGDLVMVDKSFIVDWSVVSTSTVKGVIDESLAVASSSLAASINTASSSVVSQLLSSITSIPANVWSYSGRTLTSFGTLVADVWTNATRRLSDATLDSGSIATLSDVQTASSSVISQVNSNTNAQVISASSSLALAVSSSQTAINANTDTRVNTASSSLIATLPASIWSYSGRTLTSFGTLVADVWTNATRRLSDATLDSGSIATLSDVQTATSSVAAVVNSNTNAQTSGITAVINSYIDTATSTLTAQIQSGWTVTLSDFGETTVNTAYKARLQVLNHATIPTDADSLPTVVVTDSVGTAQVPAGVMTKESDGTYSYSYSINGSAVGGVWETEVSVVVNGETIKVNDYWSVSSSPADVNITEMTDKVIPVITANVRIDNMGTSNSDFYYVYCIVASEDNLCGGGDDIDYGSDTAYIVAQDHINLTLTLDEVPAVGTYWFKVKARALAETNWAASSEQFVAESGEVESGGGGGGGGGGASDTSSSGSCSGADFNADQKVNSIDFSILLSFWQTKIPFKNPCVDINKDQKVNSVDFSILLYQWKK